MKLSKNEKELFMRLGDPISDEIEGNLLEYATPAVLGLLFWNRTQAAAYANLRKSGVLGAVNREFRAAVAGAYEQNCQRNQSYYTCMKELHSALSRCGCSYAMLKGAYLCGIYPNGYRTSNDIDILVMPKDVTIIGEALIEAGFLQGYIRNGNFVCATREEIITSKMMRGETVPYIKEVGLPQMQYLEVDINFSLDYKNGDEGLLENMLKRSTDVKCYGNCVHTLSDDDFFIHLCAHLYKEATTLPWIEMKRDMTLYKYCDIHMMLSNMTESYAKKFLRRAKELEMEKVCAYAILQTAALYDIKNETVRDEAEKILENDPLFLHTVISPTDKKRYVYTERDIKERFFSDDRAKLLIEMKGGEI